MQLLSDTTTALIKALYSNDGYTFYHLDVPRLDKADVRDLLHLSINSSSADIPLAALGVFCRLDTQLSTAEVLHLLCTAVERNHTEVLISILQIVETSSLDRLTPEQLLPIIERAIVLDASALSGCLPTFAACQPAVRLSNVVGLPAVQQLPADAVAALMHKALEVGLRSSLSVLCRLPAAKDIGAAQLSSIVQAAAAKGDHDNLQLHSKATAFHQLRPAAVAAALQAAVQARCKSSLAVLLKCRSAAAICDVLVPAVVVAVHTNAGDLLEALLAKAIPQRKTYNRSVDQTARFSAEGCCQMLEAALTCSSMYDFHSLWQLPAAAGLQAKHLGQLLRCAAAAAPPRCGGSCAEVVDRYLRRHPAWSSVSEEDKQAWPQGGAGSDAPISAAGTGGPSTSNSEQPQAVLAPAVVFRPWPMPPQATPSAPGNSWTWPLPAATLGGGH